MPLDLPAPRKGQHSPWRMPGLDMWLWGMSDPHFPSALGKMLINQWRLENWLYFHGQRTLEMLFPTRCLYIMWGQENQGSPVLPLPWMQVTAQHWSPMRYCSHRMQQGSWTCKFGCMAWLLPNFTLPGFSKKAVVCSLATSSSSLPFLPFPRHLWAQDPAAAGCNRNPPGSLYIAWENQAILF